MKKTKTTLSLLAALLLATLAFSQAQRQLQVLVTSDRTAAIRMRPTDGRPGLSGDVRATADLAGGTSALQADLKLEGAEKLGDGSAAAFLEMTPETVEMIGKADLPMPSGEEDALDEIHYSLASVTEDGTSHTRAEFRMVGPADRPVPTVSVSGTTEGSSDVLSGTVDYSVTLPRSQAGRIPVTDLSLTVAEESAGSDEGETVTTTVRLSVTAPEGSPVEGQLRSAPQAGPMIEQQLRQAGIQVEAVDVPPVEETDAGLTAEATVAVSDLRGTLTGLMDEAGRGMSPDTLVDPRVLTAALEKMSEARLDTFELTMSVEGATVSGTVSGEASRVRNFFAGYVEIVQMMVGRAAAAREDSVPGELGAYVGAFEAANLEQQARWVEAVFESDMSFRGEGALDVSAADGTMKLDGEFDLDVQDYGDFAEKAEASGLPVVETARMTADLNLTDAGRLEGRYYLRSDRGLLRYGKQFVLEALDRAEGGEEAASIVRESSLEEAAFSLDLQGRELTVRGHSRTSPLTRAGRAFLREVAPRVDARPDGAHVEYAFYPDGTGEGEVLFRFTDFMPDRSAAEIREALGLAETAEVRMDAAPGAVTLAGVDRPDVRVSGELAAVRSSAQDLLASGGAGDGGGGAPDWMLIAAGVLVVALVGVGWAFARKAA